MNELQQQCRDKLKELFVYANNTLKCNTLLQEPSLSFDQRGKIAGSAHLIKNHIKLNRTLLYENPEDFLKEIIAHELCHILAHQLYGRTIKPHGPQWRYLMKAVFDLEPKVTHKLDVKSVKQNEFEYKCECSTVMLSLIRHNKILRNKARYFCKRCHSELSLVN